MDHRQEHINFGSGISFDIDMVIYDMQSGDPIFVLDTKYKLPESVSSQNVAQIVSYAKAKGCREGIRIYPIKIAKPVDILIGKHSVKTPNFFLDDDIEESGIELLFSLA